MALEHLTPKGLFRPANYSQVVVAIGRRMVFVSGQVSMDRNGKLVADGDFAGQAKQVYWNLSAALAGAGASPSDVTKLTTCVVGYRPDLRPMLGEAHVGGEGRCQARAVPAGPKRAS